MTEEDRIAKEAIEQLLTPEFQRQMAEMANKHFICYAPILLPEADPNSTRFHQFMRWLIEYVIGAPTKIIDYIKMEFQNKRVAWLIVPPIIVGTYRYLRVAFRTLLGCVGSRLINLMPKQQVVDVLNK